MKFLESKPSGLKPEIKATVAFVLASHHLRKLERGAVNIPFLYSAPVSKLKAKPWVGNCTQISFFVTPSLTLVPLLTRMQELSVKQPERGMLTS